MSLDHYFDGRISREFRDLMLGKFLGSGVGREVYVFRPDPTFVIKFETGNQSFQNIREWDLWNDLAEQPKLRKWLAPINSISPSGDILMQRRTTPMRKNELPKRVPAFATDLKIQNWGLLDGQPVMHDYGFIRQEALKGKLETAKWWGFENE